MSDPGPRQTTAGPAEAEQVRVWLDDIRAVLRELEGMSHRSGGAQGAAVDCRSDLARVLADLEALPRLSTEAAFLAASAANSGARYLLTVATGSGSIAEPDDSAWWVAHAMWLLGRAQQHADVAHTHAKRLGRPPGSGRNSAAILRQLDTTPPGASNEAIANAVLQHEKIEVDANQVSKVRNRMASRRRK